MVGQGILAGYERNALIGERLRRTTTSGEARDGDAHARGEISARARTL
jgi:hypothetical protein